MKKRREARVRALEILYQHEITGQSIDEIIKVKKSLGQPVDEFSLELIKGVEVHLKEIDTHIAYASDRWTLERMPAIDRNILRVATYEIFYEKEIPVSVSINEAIEIAKEYGTPDSGKFVNGVLGAIAQDVNKSESP